ncbi:MAG: P1 family peptidase [bacterium]|nr:P1 family peptidase [bacterium]
MLTGGSAFGLAAADGVMRYLAGARPRPSHAHQAHPIVPTAVVFDLGFNWGQAARTPHAGYAAYLAAGDGPSQRGNVGAGAGRDGGQVGRF